MFLQNKYKGSKLLITGHSLGGALATLAALEVIRMDVKVDYF